MFKRKMSWTQSFLVFVVCATCYTVFKTTGAEKPTNGGGGISSAQELERQAQAGTLQRAPEKSLTVDEMAAKMQADMCGPKPLTGRGTARVAFQQRAKDPDSVKVSKCSDPVLTAEDCWVIECTVRARNGFGAMGTGRHKFSYRKGVGNVRVLN